MYLQAGNNAKEICKISDSFSYDEYDAECRCDVGQGLDPVSKSCKVCQPGQFNDGVNTTCTQCPSGTRSISGNFVNMWNDGIQVNYDMSTTMSANEGVCDPSRNTEDLKCSTCIGTGCDKTDPKNGWAASYDHISSGRTIGQSNHT